MTRRITIAVALAVAVSVVSVIAAPRTVTFGAVATPVPVNEAFVVTVTVEGPDAKDCTKDVAVAGDLRSGDREPLRAQGTCDSPDGSTFHVRFVPAEAGDYDWTVTYTQGEYVRTGHGSITVVPR